MVYYPRVRRKCWRGLQNGRRRAVSAIPCGPSCSCSLFGRRRLEVFSPLAVDGPLWLGNFLEELVELDDGEFV